MRNGTKRMQYGCQSYQKVTLSQIPKILSGASVPDPPAGKIQVGLKPEPVVRLVDQSGPPIQRRDSICRNSRFEYRLH